MDELLTDGGYAVHPTHEPTEASRSGSCAVCGVSLDEAAVEQECPQEPRRDNIGGNPDAWSGGFAENH